MEVTAGWLSAFVGVMAALTGVLGLILRTWWRLEDRIESVRTELKADSRTAHSEIRTNIRTVGEDVRTSEKRVTDNFNARFDDLRDYIKLAMNPPRGGRPSESGQDRP